MANIEGMKKDTEQILTEWGIKVVVKRLSVAYSGIGEPEEDFLPVDQGGTTEVESDLQPIGGTLSSKMEGVLSTATHRAFFPLFTDIQPNDRVYSEEDRFFTVLRVDVNPDHIVSYLEEKR
jgi:hypothetical protein